MPLSVLPMISSRFFSAQAYLFATGLANLHQDLHLFASPDLKISHVRYTESPLPPLRASLLHISGGDSPSTFFTFTFTALVFPLHAFAFPLNAFAANIRPYGSHTYRAGATTDDFLGGAVGTLISPLTGFHPDIHLHRWNELTKRCSRRDTVTAGDSIQCSEATIPWPGAAVRLPPTLHRCLSFNPFIVRHMG